MRPTAPARTAPPSPARSERREARVAVVLFWTLALLLVGARVAVHDDIAGGGTTAPSGLVSVPTPQPG